MTWSPDELFAVRTEKKCNCSRYVALDRMESIKTSASRVLYFLQTIDVIEQEFAASQPSKVF
jgi:hypothetical protein